ncbi:MAG TPA: L,D-transpeptidase family protein [Xanthomonadales bacterium]|nr:L,D-transpeptidase family protein [Xanthomonadales bacterium]
MTLPRLFLIGAVVALAGCGSRSVGEIDHEAALAQRLSQPPAWAGDAVAWRATRIAYARNDGDLLWLGSAHPTRNAELLAATLASARDEALDPSRYDVRDALALAPEHGVWPLRRYDVRAAAEADVRITYAAARYVHDLAYGTAPRDALGNGWVAARADNAAASTARLVQAASRGDTQRLLRQAAPRHPQYARLREALAHLRAVEANGGWLAVPEALKVKAGETDPGIEQVRARLVADGDLPAGSAGTMLDDTLQEALRRVQHRHGLAEDGVPGKSTLAALNVPVSDRIREIELAMERWRWLPRKLGERHVLVNIPAFELMAREHGRTALAMRVVTGRPYTPTPTFSDTMETVVFSPFWHVPPSIMANEVKPALREDPAYLAKKNMELVRNGEAVDPWSVDLEDPALRVRQRPGAGNALGQVKFLFPNRFDVYLHDTPQDSLFARSGLRSFSHGCIRVEQPQALAEWVLAGQEPWTTDAIAGAMQSGNERHVRLARKIPVHIVYQTAWVEDDGTLRFLPDVYSHDARQVALVPQLASPVAAGDVAIAEAAP